MKKIAKHPALNFSEDIAEICKPLKKLNINYFAHVRVDNNNEFSALASSPGFTDHYLRNQYYNADIHMASSNRFGNYVIWDTIERVGQSEKMHLEAAAFGIKHTFTVIEKNKNHTDFYHFANASESKTINQVYLSNLDLLKLFILHFNENVSRSNALSRAYDLTFKIDPKAEGYTVKNPHSFVCEKEEFISILDVDHGDKLKPILPELEIDKKLSKREIDCLFYYVQGKITQEISTILGLSKRTVEHYLSNAKSKLKVLSKNELIEKVILNLLRK